MAKRHGFFDGKMKYKVDLFRNVSKRTSALDYKLKLTEQDVPFKDQKAFCFKFSNRLHTAAARRGRHCAEDVLAGNPAHSDRAEMQEMWREIFQVRDQLMFLGHTRAYWAGNRRRIADGYAIFCRTDLMHHPDEHARALLWWSGRFYDFKFCPNKLDSESPRHPIHEDYWIL